MKKQKIEIYFLLTVVAVIVGSFAVFGILLVDVDGSIAQRAGAYAVAAVFWCSLIAEICMVCICSKERKSLENQKNGSAALKNAKPGIISFATSREGMISDMVLLVFVIILVIVIVSRIQISWVIMTTVSIFYLAFNMHCLLNGRNYRYIKTLKN